MKTAIALLALATAVPAAEIVRRDLQLALGTAPTDFTYAIASPGGSFSGTDAFDVAVEARLGARWALIAPGWSIAPVFGGDLQYRSATYASGGGLSATGAAATAGVAYALNDRWSSDLELAVSYELASLNLSSGSGLAGSGSLVSTALRLRTLRQLNRTWSVGVEMGWERGSGSFAADRSRDVTIDLDGWTGGLIAVWRTSMRPADLE